MNIDEIKLEIKDRISKTDQTFITTIGSETIAGISGEDIGSLEIVLKKVTRNFKIFTIAAILFSTLLIVVSMLKYFDSIDHFNMNNAGIVILSSFSFLLLTISHYKVKVNLENKIWLLRLLDQIEKS